MTLEELKAFIASKHNPDYAKRPGMVYQIWEDGEVTLQKGGDLLWRRNLHSIRYPKNGPLGFSKDIMPVVEKEHGYAFIEEKDIEPIFEAMLSTKVA